MERQRIEPALRAYIERLDEDAQNRVLPGWRKCGSTGKKQVKTVVTKLDDIQREGLAFLNHRQGQRARDNPQLKSSVSRTAVLGALAALREGYSWNVDNKVQDLWAECSSLFASKRFKQSSPTERLSILHEDSNSSACSSEYKRRITALLIQHERQQKRTNKSDRAKEKARDVAEHKKKSRANITDAMQTARAWSRFIEVWGLGGLVMPGPGYKQA